MPTPDLFERVVEHLAGTIREYNPYHDERGRFSTSNSSTFVSLAGKDIAQRHQQQGGSPGDLTGSSSGAGGAFSAWGDRAGEIASAKTAPNGMRDEGVIRSAYEGTFAGFKTKVNEIESYGVTTTVRGEISDKDGNYVGRFTRKIGIYNADGQPSADGKPRVDHQYLELKREAQGGGFAREFNRNAENHYIANGVTHVDIHANPTVGGYAWARQGFDFADDRTREQIRSHVRADLFEEGLKQITERIKQGYHPTQDDYVQMSQRVEAVAVRINHSWDAAGLVFEGAHVGKGIMLGSSWDGVKVLSPNHATSAVGEAAYQSKK